MKYKIVYQVLLWRFVTHYKPIGLLEFESPYPYFLKIKYEIIFQIYLGDSSLSAIIDYWSSNLLILVIYIIKISYL